MSKVNQIFIELNFNCETESVELRGIVLHCGRSFLTWVVLDVVSGPMPTLKLGLCFSLRVCQGLHPMGVKAVWLDQVNYVEFIKLALFCV